MKNIRNFCIIAHIDHGKSTLADRFLELTKTVPKEKMRPQFLDRMPLERERGITIKLQPVTMTYQPTNLQTYQLNLIDTPGHIDFFYEVSRSLAAVEGAILLVDASQGIQAQTLTNLDLAQRQNLVIVPVINKIDLPNLDLESVRKELADLLKIDSQEVILASAKNGTGIEEILKAVVRKIPPPEIDLNKPLRALIFDSFFDDYRGVVAFVRIFDGEIRTGEKIKMLGSGAETQALEVGILKPDLTPVSVLEVGEIGYIVTGLKETAKCRVGDTITQARINADQNTDQRRYISVNQPASTRLSRRGGRSNQRESAYLVEPLPGYQEPKPMVFAGIYPIRGEEGPKLRQALGKLKLNDASLFFEPEFSAALGFGFRAGFLGLLHLEIVKERLKREYDLDLILTTPLVAYQVKMKTGEEKIIRSPQELPDPTKISQILEPWLKLEIITPVNYLGPIMEMVTDYRGKFISLEYLGQGSDKKHQRAVLYYEIPLALILVDFYDKLKSLSAGYASLSYEFLDYRAADLTKLDILVASEKIEALSTIVYRDEAYQQGRKIVEALKKVLPRQLFEVKIQAAVAGKILASEHLPPMRKDVTAKLYGGDVTRKMKLLTKQKKGKKKLLKLGKVNIPAEAYLAVLRR